MLLILPAVFLIVGLGLGCGLAYANYRTRSFLRSLEQARWCQAGGPVEGSVKIQGVARAVDPKELLTSPIDQRPSVYYKLVIEEYRSNAGVIRNASPNRRTQSTGSWVRVIEDTQAIPMVIADDTGAIPLDPKAAKLDLKTNQRHANIFKGLPKELEQSLRDRYKIVTATGIFPKQMRYTEVVIAEGAEVFVHGDCEVEDGKAEFTT
jgi:hypothetical protein